MRFCLWYLDWGWDLLPFKISIFSLYPISFFREASLILHCIIKVFSKKVLYLVVDFLFKGDSWSYPICIFETFYYEMIILFKLYALTWSSLQVSDSLNDIILMWIFFFSIGADYWILSFGFLSLQSFGLSCIRIWKQVSFISQELFSIWIHSSVNEVRV